MDKNDTIRYSKRGFLAILGINYIAILIYNFLTPPMSDDLYLRPGQYKPLSEILSACWHYYNNWLGRIESEFFTRISDAYPKPVYNFVSSVFFIALILALYFNIEREKKWDCRTLSLIALYIWIWGIDFAQTMLWVCGACNYLWCLAIEFGFLAYYRYVINRSDLREAKETTVISRCLSVAGIFLWGLLAGDGNESSSGGVFLLVLFFTLKNCVDNGEGTSVIDKIKNSLTGFEISGIIGFALGIIIMVAAPGNRVRGAVNLGEENQTGLLMYMGRFLKINHTIYEYMSVLIVAITILLVYIHIYKRKSIKDLKDIYVYLIVAMISIYVLILTTIPMPRAFMGGSLILLIACIQLVQYIKEEDATLNTITIGSIILMATFMLYSYVDNSANLARILRELDERQQYVDEQKAAGNFSLTLPMLREEWDNRYTYIYHYNDVNEEPDSFGNRIYRAYYGLDEVIGVPWDEWEEMLE